MYLYKHTNKYIHRERERERERGVKRGPVEGREGEGCAAD